MAQIVLSNVEWLVFAVEPRGERIVRRFMGDEDEGKALRYAISNRKRWSVRKRVELKVYRKGQR